MADPCQITTTLPADPQRLPGSGLPQRPIVKTDICAREAPLFEWRGRSSPSCRSRAVRLTPLDRVVAVGRSNLTSRDVLVLPVGQSAKGVREGPTVCAADLDTGSNLADGQRWPPRLPTPCCPTLLPTSVTWRSWPWAQSSRASNTHSFPTKPMARASASSLLAMRFQNAVREVRDLARSQSCLMHLGSRPG
jgi:hypothetical protein